MLKVLVDPGHGGIDPGAVGNGLLEKMLTLQISKRIEAMLLEYENVLVKLTRDTDKTLTLNQRTDMANEWGADFLLSVHINAFNGKSNGYEDFIYPGSGAATTAHQNVIHEEIMKQVDFHNRGKKQGNLHMLRESNMPALLTENGFIDNPNDAAKLKQSAFIDKIARGHVNGIVKAFGLKSKVKLAGIREEDNIMAQSFKPTSEAINNSVAVVLKRFEKKDPALAKVWREQFLKGEMKISDAVGLLYVAVERGYIQGIPK